MKIFNIHIITERRYKEFLDCIDTLRETKVRIEKENSFIKKRVSEVEGQAYATYHNWEKLREKNRDLRNTIAMRESTIRNLMQENNRLRKKCKKNGTS